MAQGNIIKTVTELTGKKAEKIKQEMQICGDLAETVMKAKTAQKLLKKPSTLTLKKVYNSLLYMAMQKGKGATTLRIQKYKELLVSCE